MSDKITKQVIYEIEPSGNCRFCKSRRGLYQCLAFDIDVKWTGSEYINCRACRDYLAEHNQKQKITCHKCGAELTIFNKGFVGKKLCSCGAENWITENQEQPTCKD